MTTMTIAKGSQPIALQLGMLNRHGLIAGATGTGKTVTLKVLTRAIKFSWCASLFGRYQRRPV